MTIWGVVVLVKIVVWGLLEASGSLIFCTHKRWWPVELHQPHSSQKFCEEALRLPPIVFFFFFFSFMKDLGRWKLVGGYLARKWPS